MPRKMRSRFSACISVLNGMYFNAFYGSRRPCEMRSHLSASIFVLDGVCFKAGLGLAEALKEEISFFSVYFVARLGVF